MKKIQSIVFLLALMLILTGCTVSINTEVTLDKNGNAVVSTKFLAPEALNEMFDNELTNAGNHKEEGIEISKVSENGKVGIIKTTKSSKVYKNDIKMPEVFETKSDNKRFVNVAHNYFYTNYKLDWIFKITENPQTHEVVSKEFQEFIEPHLKINLPTKAQSSNADSRNDMTNSYEWSLIPTKSNNINLEYNIVNWLNIVLFIITLINLIAVILLFVLKKDKKYFIILSAILTILILYIAIFSIICCFKNNTNKKPLPINYYETAAKEASYCEGELDCGGVIDDFAAVKINDKYGLVDKKNKFIIKAENEDIVNLFGDYCLVCPKDAEKCAYFNKKEKKYLTDFKYSSTGNSESGGSQSFSEGLAMVVISDHGDVKVGFINSKGEEVIEPKYVSAEEFRDGRALVYKDWHSDPIYIDKKGNEIKEKNKKTDKNEEELSTENNKKTEEVKEVDKASVSTPQAAQKQAAPKQTKPKTETKASQQTQPARNQDVDDFMN